MTSVIDLTERKKAEEVLRVARIVAGRWSSKPSRASCYST